MLTGNFQNSDAAMSGLRKRSAIRADAQRSTANGPSRRIPWGIVRKWNNFHAFGSRRLSARSNTGPNYQERKESYTLSFSERTDCPVLLRRALRSRGASGKGFTTIKNAFIEPLRRLPMETELRW